MRLSLPACSSSQCCVQGQRKCARRLHTYPWRWDNLSRPTNTDLPSRDAELRTVGAKSSPEAAWARRTCGQTRMALQHTQVQLVTRRKASVHAQQTRDRQTHLLGARGHVQAKRMGLRAAQACIHAHSIGDGSRTPANALESPDLPVRGAVPCMGEPERPRDETDVPDTQSDAGNSKRPANVSETSVMRDLLTRCAEPRVGEPKRFESPTDASDACTEHCG